MDCQGSCLTVFRKIPFPPFSKDATFSAKINSPELILDPRSSLNWHDGGGVPAAIQLVPQLSFGKQQLDYTPEN